MKRMTSLLFLMIFVGFNGIYATVEVAAVPIDLSCNSANGEADGALDLVASSGTAPYTYLWTTMNGTGLVATNEDQDGLSAGTYTVLVTDATGCTTTDSWTITEPTSLNVVGTPTDLGCNIGSGAADGAIDITVIGGTAPYAYAWSTSDGSGIAVTNEDQSNISAGTYNVTVTDANGCVVTETWTVTEPTEISILGTTTDLSCNSIGGITDGAIIITTSGGTPPYSYLWTTASGSGLTATSVNQSGLSAGTYTVLGIDAYGCTVTESWTIVEPSMIEVVSAISNLSCNSSNGVFDGMIDITLSGGTAPFTYAWSTSDGSGLEATSEDQIGLAIGTYYVEVADADGCSIHQQYQITEPLPIIVFDEEIISPTGSKSNGSITVEMGGGTPPYEYQWNNGNTSNQINDLEKGQYHVFVTDMMGCVFYKEWDLSTFGVTQRQLEIGGANLGEDKDQVKILNRNLKDGKRKKLHIYPNPVSNQLTLELNLNETVKSDIAIYNLTGARINDIGSFNFSTLKLDVDVSSLENGLYFVQVNTEKKKIVKRFTVVK